jgi:hypothetical protein
MPEKPPKPSPKPPKDVETHDTGGKPSGGGR